MHSQNERSKITIETRDGEKVTHTIPANPRINKAFVEKAGATGFLHIWDVEGRSYAFPVELIKSWTLEALPDAVEGDPGYVHDDTPLVERVMKEVKAGQAWPIGD